MVVSAPYGFWPLAAIDLTCVFTSNFYHFASNSRDDNRVFTFCMFTILTKRGKVLADYHIQYKNNEKRYYIFLNKIFICKILLLNRTNVSNINLYYYEHYFN